MVNDDIQDLLDAHEAMAAVLDAKWPDLKEWKAFRAIDRALLAALTKTATSRPPPTPLVRPWHQRLRMTPDGTPIPYMTLAERALGETGLPQSTTALMTYITAHRPVSGDPKNVRNVVQSSLSKDERFRSIPWEGGRAWWYADKPVPKKETAGD
jgi:hypothetical protein